LESVNSFRDFDHGNHPPAQFVEVAFLAYGLVKLFKAYRPAMVGGTDLDQGLAQRSPFVRILSV
jgi:hypothetical protein